MAARTLICFSSLLFETNAKPIGQNFPIVFAAWRVGHLVGTVLGVVMEGHF